MRIATPQRDLISWKHLIDEAVQEPNSALSNLKVTQAHYLLSLALRDVVGTEGGANFHSWAVWGSRKAGETIREEGLDRALREVTVLALGLGLLTGFILGEALSFWLSWWVVPGLSALGAVGGACTGRGWLILGRRRAAELMLVGNRTVLEDIGSQTARFVAWYAESDSHDSASFTRFLEGFRLGATQEGGQNLLRRAFTSYCRAALSDEAPTKQQHTYFANCLAILHEHIRLQPYIAGALPLIVRRCVTCRLMRYDVGPLMLTVGDDVPRLNGLEYPESLQTLTDHELIEFLIGQNGLDRGGNTLAGTAARDWTRLAQRMKYIVYLFRALHLHPDVVASPYTAEQFEQIQFGRLPPGRL